MQETGWTLKGLEWERQNAENADIPGLEPKEEKSSLF